MSHKLSKPYTEAQKFEFIVKYSNNNGLTISETEEALYALEENEIMTPVEVEKEITELVTPAVWKEIEVQDTKTVAKPVYDDEGNPVINEYGEQEYELVEEPIYIEEYTYNVYETDENGFIKYDDEGNPIILETVTVPGHYQTHIEKIKISDDVYETKTITVEIPRPSTDPEYEEKKELARKKEIAMLHLTAADVERAIYKATGMDFDDIINKVSEIQTLGMGTDIDIKALKIELKANDFYRGNPYIDSVGQLLGFTPDMLDDFFATNDYTKLITET